MKRNKWMIYGAYGYMGNLIVQEAVSRGFQPVIAGRNCKKLQSLAKRFNLEFRCFNLKDSEKIQFHLDQIDLVLNCAGPFTSTSVPLAKSAMKAGADYLDITNEIDVIDYLYMLDDKTIESGTLLCPGVGFHVIASDCMASALKKWMPDGKNLVLAFKLSGSPSPGWIKTMIEGFRNKGMIRKNGIIKTVKLAYDIRKIDFGSGPEPAVTVPWGDISTAFYAAGIPNISVYTTYSVKVINLLKILRIFGPILARELVQKFLKKMIDFQITGPTAREREKTPVRLWAEVKNSQRQCLHAHLITPNAYDVTIKGSLGIVEKLMTHRPKPGVYTPSQLMGTHYISQLPGCSPITIFTNY